MCTQTLIDTSTFEAIPLNQVTWLPQQLGPSPIIPQRSGPPEPSECVFCRWIKSCYSAMMEGTEQQRASAQIAGPAIPANHSGHGDR